MRRVLCVAVGVWLLVDVLRVWTPSLITIFGQAASTPAELMGAFALAVVVAGCLPLLVVRFTAVPEPTMAAIMLVCVLLSRVALQVVGGGQPQLWCASIGVACAVAWCCLATRVLGDAVVEGYAAGLALAAATHAALGSWGAVWRDDVWGWGLLLVQVVLVVGVLPGQPEPRSAPRMLAFALLPTYLLAGTWAANPARASSTDQGWGPVLVVVGAVAALVLVRLDRPPRGLTLGAGVVLTGATAAVMMPDASSLWTLPAFVLGMPALVVVLGALAESPPAGSEVAPVFTAAGGAVLWVALFFAYYAGYDLGYRADLLLVLLAAALAAAAVRVTLRSQGPAPGPGFRLAVGRTGGVLVAIGLVAVLAAGLGPRATVSQVEATSDDHEGLRVVAWNLRMGYGMDGTFEPRKVAELIADLHPDVVLLSEIDRAWLLNGGQDQLAILARLLGMDAYFGPAADPVWGDAVLTDLPVSGVDAHPLPSYDAVTGAQALAVTVTLDGLAYDVISTHVQPHDSDGDGSLEQARDIARFAVERAKAGNPVIVAGDFNLQPGDPSWQALLDSGLRDALGEERPVLTSPADDPDEQIDHVFATVDLVADTPRAVPSELSDHLPVTVTLRPAG
ncbi:MULTISPECIES: endonuclease/exonuclease/phosphatase family protein [unclassified Nocardioides]|uniref:endonuclease/exonuclease/phosphatase family protein n=1 Tax=unclassified Nocardioides TaxID=2615069 RepID=UPI000AF98405|nr:MULTISPECIES: endonuclease/exonuclease/phosphatase family protein [unclassified Nocardioides]